MSLHECLGEIDRAIHEPARLLILCHLKQNKGHSTFSELHNRLRLTKGNLGAMLKVLAAIEYVTIKRTLQGKKTCSEITLTRLGERRIKRYHETMKFILGHL